MTITDIKTVVTNAGMRNWVFVKVETDTPGLAGWGGYWLPAEAPGLGVEASEKAAARHPFVQEPLQSVIYARDEALQDWEKTVPVLAQAPASTVY